MTIDEVKTSLSSANCRAGCHEKLIEPGKLKLFFDSRSGPLLTQIHFCHPLMRKIIKSKRRGVACGDENSNFFPWSAAVRGLAILLLRSIIPSTKQEFSGGLICFGGESYLQGLGKSAAASLDYALSKNPRWLLEMFGRDSMGKPLCRLLTNRINSARRRAGPVLIGLNPDFIPAANIEVYLDSKPVRRRTVIEKILQDIIFEKT